MRKDILHILLLGLVIMIDKAAILRINYLLNSLCATALTTRFTGYLVKISLNPTLNIITYLYHLTLATLLDLKIYYSLYNR